MSQEDLNQKWEAGVVDVRLTSFFDSDVHDLSQALREWCRTGGEFPFRVGPDGPPTPLTRTAMTIHFLRRVDRLWHWDQPVVFEFRPISRQEAYKWEADYWRSVNDFRRAELADEIRVRLEQPTTDVESHGPAEQSGQPAVPNSSLTKTVLAAGDGDKS